MLAAVLPLILACGAGRYLESFGGGGGSPTTHKSRFLGLALKAEAVVVLIASVAMAAGLCIAAGVKKVPVLPVGNSLALAAIQWILACQEAVIFLYTQRIYLKREQESVQSEAAIKL